MLLDKTLGQAVAVVQLLRLVAQTLAVVMVYTLAVAVELAPKAEIQSLVDLQVELLHHQAVAVEQDFLPMEPIAQPQVAVRVVLGVAAAVALMALLLLLAATVVFLFTTKIEGEKNA
jgi:hypothetical protein